MMLRTIAVISCLILLQNLVKTSSNSDVKGGGGGVLSLTPNYDVKCTKFSLEMLPYVFI